MKNKAWVLLGINWQSLYELLCNYRYKRLPWDWRDSRLDYGPSLQKDNHVLSLVIPVPERVFGMQCYCLMIINYVKIKTYFGNRLSIIWQHTETSGCDDDWNLRSELPNCQSFVLYTFPQVLSVHLITKCNFLFGFYTDCHN